MDNLPPALAQLLSIWQIAPASVDLDAAGVLTTATPEASRRLRRPTRLQALADAVGVTKLTINARTQPDHPHPQPCDDGVATTRHRRGGWASGRNYRCYGCGTNPEQGPVWQDTVDDGNAGRLCVTCIQDGVILHNRKATARIGMARERDLQDWLFHDIAQDFHVQREVEGRLPYGGTVIVDGIISPRDTTGWTDDAPAFAVEVKALIGRHTSTGDHTKWLAQMIDYTWADFDGHGRLPVLAAPGPVLTDHLNCTTVPKLLGRVGVGELVPFINHGWTIRLQEHRIWSEAKGPVKNWSVHLRTGSR